MRSTPAAATRPQQQRPLFQHELPASREVGVLARLRATEDPHHLILVSEYGQGVRHNLLTNALASLLNHTAARERVSWVGLQHQLRDVQKKIDENSQRSRGFLFFSIAAAVATTMGVTAVASFETGIGALNPAMNAAQAGALHCGSCTSCLFRRSAHWHALRGKDPTKYRDKSAKSHAQHPVEAYHQHALALARAATDWKKLMAIDPSIRFAVERFAATPDDRPHVEDKVLSLAQRHAGQVLAFLESSEPHVGPRPTSQMEATRDLL